MRRASLAVCLIVVSRDAVAQDEVRVRGQKPATLAASATEGELPRETTDLASLIAPLPGVYVRRQGADDSLSTLSIRGTSPQQAAVYLAGVPVTGGGDPAIDLSLLPVWPKLQARVYRTFAPASLGRPALGGALVLDAPTLAAEAGTTETYAAVGSYGVARARAATLTRVGRAKVAATAFGARADNDFSYLDPIASSFARRVYLTRENAGYAATGGLLEVAVPLGDATLTATAYGQWRRQRIAGPVRQPTPDQSVDSGRSLGSVDLSVPFGQGTAHVQLYERYDTVLLRDSLADARLTASPTRQSDAFVTVGVRTGVRQRIGSRSTVGVHADAMREAYLPGRGPGSGRSSLGVAGEWEAAVAERVKGGLQGRVDAWSDFGATQKTTILPTGYGTLDVRLLRSISFVGRVGRTARAPSFLERFGNQGIFVGDSELRPESAWTEDAGLRASAGRETRRAQLEIVGFRTSARDLIQFVPQGAFGRARATNLQRADLAGLEVLGQARYQLLDLRVVYNYLYTANRLACDAVRLGDGVCEAPPLPGRPRHNFTGDVGVHVGPATVRYGVDVVSGMRADLVGAIPIPPRTLQSAGVRVRFPRNVLVGADVRNLANVRAGTYPGALGPTLAPIGDQYDYPLPGRTWFAFVRFTGP